MDYCFYFKDPQTLGISVLNDAAKEVLRNGGFDDLTIYCKIDQEILEYISKLKLKKLRLHYLDEKYVEYFSTIVSNIKVLDGPNSGGAIKSFDRIIQVFSNGSPKELMVFELKSV